MGKKRKNGSRFAREPTRTATQTPADTASREAPDYATNVARTNAAPLRDSSHNRFGTDSKHGTRQLIEKASEFRKKYEYSKELEMYKRALEVNAKERMYEKREFWAATLYKKIGLVYYNKGHYEAALKSFGEARTKLRRLTDYNYMKLRAPLPLYITTSMMLEEVDTAEYMATVYTTIGNADMAVRMFEDVLRNKLSVYSVFEGVNQRVLAKLKVSLLETKINLFRALTFKGDFDIALAMCDEVVNSMEGVMKPDQVVVVLHNRVDLLACVSDFGSTGLTDIKRAREISLNFSPSKRLQLARIEARFTVAARMHNALPSEELDADLVCLSNELKGKLNDALQEIPGIVGHYRIFSVHVIEETVDALFSVLCFRGEWGELTNLLLDAVVRLRTFADREYHAPLTMSLARMAVQVSPTCELRARSLLELVKVYVDCDMLSKAISAAEQASELQASNDAKNALADARKRYADMCAVCDEDLVGQREHIAEQYLELRIGYMRDLEHETTRELSTVSHNRTTEIFVTMLHLQDQAFARVARVCKSESCDVYFPGNVTSAAALEAVLAKAKLSVGADAVRSAIAHQVVRWDLCASLSALKQVLEQSPASHHERNYYFFVGGLRTVSIPWPEYCPEGEAADVLTKLIEEERTTGKPVKLKSLYNFVEKKLREETTRCFEEELVTAGSVRAAVARLTNSTKLPLKWTQAVADAVARVHSTSLEKTCEDSFKFIVNEAPFTLFESMDPDAIFSSFAVRSWIDKIYAIGNDSKHVRLVPTTVYADLESWSRLLPVRLVRIFIDCSGSLPQLTDWSLFDALRLGVLSELGIYTNAELREFSREVRYRLFQTNGGYFEKTCLGALCFYRLVHPKADEYTQACSDKDRKSVLTEFRARVLEDLKDRKISLLLAARKPEVTEKKDVEARKALKEGVWQFVMAHTLRRDPFQPTEQMRPDCYVDVLDVLSLSCKKTNDMLTVLGKDARALSNRLGSSVVVDTETDFDDPTERALKAVDHEQLEIIISTFETCLGAASTERTDRAHLGGLLISASNASRAHWRLLGSSFDSSTRREHAEKRAFAWVRLLEKLREIGAPPWLCDRVREKAISLLRAAGTMLAQQRRAWLHEEGAEASEAADFFDEAEREWAAARDAWQYLPRGDGERHRPFECGERLRNVKSRRGTIDNDIYSQLQHCRQRLRHVRYEMFRVALQPSRRRRLLHAMCVATDVAVKLLHLLDQSLARFARLCIGQGAQVGVDVLQCQFPIAGCKECVKKRLIKTITCNTKDEMVRKRAEVMLESDYISVLEAVHKVQSYGVDATTGWLAPLRQCTNKLKHVALRLPARDELDAWLTDTARSKELQGLLPIKIRTRRSCEHASDPIRRGSEENNPEWRAFDTILESACAEDGVEVVLRACANAVNERKQKHALSRDQET